MAGSSGRGGRAGRGKETSESLFKHKALWSEKDSSGGKEGSGKGRRVPGGREGGGCGDKSDVLVSEENFLSCPWMGLKATQHRFQTRRWETFTHPMV